MRIDGAAVVCRPIARHEVRVGCSCGTHDVEPAGCAPRIAEVGEIGNDGGVGGDEFAGRWNDLIQVGCVRAKLDPETKMAWTENLFVVEVGTILLFELRFRERDRPVGKAVLVPNGPPAEDP